MRVLIVEPGNKPYPKEIDGSLKSMQEVVGGYIEAVYPFEDEGVALICNEEGKLIGLPPNRFLRDEEGYVFELVAGTFFLCEAPSDSESFESLSEEMIKKYSEVFTTWMK